MIVPTVRGWIFLLAGLVCLLLAYGTGQRGLLVPGALLLAIVMIGALSLIPVMRKGRFEMRMPADVREGAGDDIMLHADPAFVGGKFRWRSIASGHWTPWTRLEGERGAIFTGDLSRGVYPVVPLRVRAVDALGVWYYRSRRGDRQQLTVGPQVISLESLVQSGFGSQSYANLLGVTDQVDQLVRDHRREDGMRRVHWKQSAKHDRLMARKEEPPSVGSVTVVFDTVRESYLDRDEFDDAVRTFASLLVTLSEHGLDIRVVESGKPALSPHVTKLGERELVRALADFDVAEPASLPSPGNRERVHVITGERPVAFVREFIGELGRQDTVWGASDEVVQRGRAERIPLVPFEAMSLERMLA